MIISIGKCIVFRVVIMYKFSKYAKNVSIVTLNETFHLVLLSIHEICDRKMEFHGDWVKHTMRIDHKSMPIEVHRYFDDPYAKEEKPLRQHYNVLYHVSFSALYK